ncbi:MAG: BMC domain-containing protein [Chitinivibrionales bacterium]|nr:BMC domain-containing protein [Chitinivibrionales bacterium]
MIDINTLGIVELTSIALGYRAQDAMLKAASVTLVLARTVCPGKYILVVKGDVASVKTSVAVGAAAAGSCLVNTAVVTNLHPAIFPALGGSVQVENPGAFGVIETFSVASILAAADAAAKAADITLFRLHLAMALGGKGFVLFTGSIGNVQAALEAGAAMATSDGMLVNTAFIAAPSPELLKEYI